MPPPQIYVEKTLAIIKPDIVDKEEEIHRRYPFCKGACRGVLQGTALFSLQYLQKDMILLIYRSSRLALPYYSPFACFNAAPINPLNKG